MKTTNLRKNEREKFEETVQQVTFSDFEMNKKVKDRPVTDAALQNFQRVSLAGGDRLYPRSS